MRTPDEAVPPEPWNSFLTGVDRALSEATHLHCLGGFVLAVWIESAFAGGKGKE